MFDYTFIGFLNITKLWNADKTWLDLCLNTSVHGQTPAPKINEPPPSFGKKVTNFKWWPDLNLSVTLESIWPGMIHISMGDLLRARAKFLPQLAEYISQGKLVGGLVGL